MELAARYMVFHGVIILLVGLLAGIPYCRAILKKNNTRLIDAWRVTHLALPIGAVLLLVLALVLSHLTVGIFFQ